VTMENFINGYPGHEHQFREHMERVLGTDKAEFFFDKVGGAQDCRAWAWAGADLQFLEYWFTEDDARLYASFGFNSIRLPVSFSSADMCPDRGDAECTYRSTTTTLKTT
jgi:hypothetical protein